MNIRENIQFVQQNLNKRGYTAGPAGGVMGPSTRNAIRSYRKNNKLSDFSDITQLLLSSLKGKSKKQPPKAKRSKKHLAKKPANRARNIYRAQMSDDFADRELRQNPPWKIKARAIKAHQTFMAIKAPGSKAPSDEEVLVGILNQALGGKSRQVNSTITAVTQGANLTNAFQVQIEIQGAANTASRMHLGPYVANDIMSGHRLVFDQNANDRLAIVAGPGGQTISVAQRDGIMYGFRQWSESQDDLDAGQGR
jgi:peptidoglycan hydrolase-like protein with peptidoglycan-binding domain